MIMWADNQTQKLLMPLNQVTMLAKVKSPFNILKSKVTQTMT